MQGLPAFTQQTMQLQGCYPLLHWFNSRAGVAHPRFGARCRDNFAGERPGALAKKCATTRTGAPPRARLRPPAAAAPCARCVPACAPQG
eukprot:358198-Chlamydomonas_euryale.AAC.11